MSSATVARSAAMYGAGLVLLVLGVAEIIRVFEDGNAPSVIRVFRSLFFFVAGIAFTFIGRRALSD